MAPISKNVGKELRSRFVRANLLTGEDEKHMEIHCIPYHPRTDPLIPAQGPAFPAIPASPNLLIFQTL